MNAAITILNFKEANDTLKGVVSDKYNEIIKPITRALRLIMKKESCNALEAFVFASEIVPEIKTDRFVKMIYMASVWEIYFEQGEE